MKARRTKDAEKAQSRGARSFGSLGNVVYEELRKQIIEGSLRPGERLREAEIANSLSVSRTPVREALKRLGSEGLFEYLPNRGAVVAGLTPQQAIELYTLRELLESEAARLAAQHALEPEIEMLRDVLRVQKEAGENPEKLARLNRVFHDTLYRLSHNRYLIDVLKKVRDYTVLLRETGYRAPGRAASAYKEHSEIVDAIARRDPEAAKAASQRHLREAQRVRMMLEFDNALNGDAREHRKR